MYIVCMHNIHIYTYIHIWYEIYHNIYTVANLRNQINAINGLHPERPNAPLPPNHGFYRLTWVSLMNSKVTKSVIHHHPRSLADVDWFLHWKRPAGGWTTHLKKMQVKLDRLLKDRSKNNEYLKPPHSYSILGWPSLEPSWITLIYHLKDQFVPKLFVQYCTYLYSKLQKATLGFWGFWGSFAPHLVRKYIIPGDPNRFHNITG